MEIKELCEKVGVSEPLYAWKSDVLRTAREEEMTSNKKLQLTKEEARYLGHVQYLKEKASPLQKALLEAGREMFSSQKIKELNEDPAFTEAGETSLKTKAMTHLQKRIESCYYAVAQFSYNMTKLTDSSKQRQRLRKKISDSKRKADVLLEIYQPLVDNSPSLDDILAGEFPWFSVQSEEGGVPIRTKRIIVEKMLERKRHQEEMMLLKKEMVFLRYFDKKLLPALKRQRGDLNMKLRVIQDRSHLSEKSTCTCQVSEENTPMVTRYESEVDKQGVIRGKIALLCKANEYAMQQVAKGVASFDKIIGRELDEFRANHQPQPSGDTGKDTEDSDFDDEEEREEKVDNFEDDEDEDEDEDDDVVVAEANAIEIATSIEISPFEFSPGVYIWKFPTGLSQGTYKGRTGGSNACSLIALLIGRRFLGNTIFPDVTAVLPLPLLAAVCASIEHGNQVYDQCRNSLPSRYLSAHEAATILTPWINVEVGVPLPVRLSDTHIPSRISVQLQERGNVLQGRQCSVAVLVMNSRTSLFIVGEQHVLFIDSHSHHDSGALLIQGDRSALDEFCETVWKIEGHSEQTFGNLSFISY